MAGMNRHEPFVRAVLMLLGALLLLAQMSLAARRNVLAGREITPAPLSLPAARSGLIAPAWASEDCLVDAVIQVESGGHSRKVGRAGERGLMQIKADTWLHVTARLYGRAISFDRAFEPELNRRVGRAYLEELRVFLRRNREKWKTDERSLLLACYNAGPTRVRESDFNPAQWPAATRDYVQRVSTLHEYYVAEGPPAVQMIVARVRVPTPSRS